MDEQLADLSNADRSLFPSSYAIRALRDSRYHNSAYAIAELVDNSIEADAPLVELLCMERSQRVRNRTRRRVAEVAVADNGEGMDAETLLEALKFGGGTRHATTRGIGKYGMGLPTSSMSQCKRVDVWTWQSGLGSVSHSMLDVDEIESGNHLVPLPDRSPIPEKWRGMVSPEILNNPTGTLVVWSKLDKIQWKTASAIIENTQLEIGRIHRRYIEEDLHVIRAASFREGSFTRENEETFVANDPIYLTRPTSTPEPWSDTPMFKPWGDEVYRHIVNGRETSIEVRYSIVKPEALVTERISQNPGNELHGRHARRNIGVSVVREDREIVLEDAFLREGGSADNPQNRWWGCEVVFRKDSDELFGVDHNKQMVANFSQAARVLGRDDRNTQLVLDEMEEDDLIARIVGDIRDQVSSMMREIKQMFTQRRRRPDPTRSRPKSPEDKATATATEADKEAVEAGKELPSPTDKDRNEMPAAERESGLVEQFVESGQPEEAAKELAQKLVKEGLGYHFGPAQLDGYQMFSVRSSQGILHINLNTEHPIYDLLRHIEGTLDEDSMDEDDPVFQATVAIRLLLSAWARMEDQTAERRERMAIQETARNWGRHADKMIDHLRERDG